MPAIGMGLAWFGYTVSLWGYCLIKGWDVKLSQLANPVRPFAWPATMPVIPASQVLPGSTAALTASTKTTRSTKTSAPAGGVTAA